MSALEEQRAVLAAKFGAILPHLDERQRRLLIGAEAQSLGHGGIRAVARAAGVCEARCLPECGNSTLEKPRWDG